MTRGRVMAAAQGYMSVELRHGRCLPHGLRSWNTTLPRFAPLDDRVELRDGQEVQDHVE